jgi:hypothetical protein
VLCFHMFQAIPEVPGGPLETRLESEAMFSNIAYDYPAGVPAGGVISPLLREGVARTMHTLPNQRRSHGAR